MPACQPCGKGLACNDRMEERFIFEVRRYRTEAARNRRIARMLICTELAIGVFACCRDVGYAALFFLVSVGFALRILYAFMTWWFHRGCEIRALDSYYRLSRDGR